MKKAAVIGLGTVSSVHLDAIDQNPEITLVGVCDIDPEKAKSAPEAVPFFTDYQEMIRKTAPDVVHICLPHYLHAPVTKQAAEMGVNVFLEKPMALNQRQADELVALEAQHPELHLGICLQNRVNASVEYLKARLDSGELGAVTGVTGIVPWFRDKAYYEQSPWRGAWATAGGGCMINQAIHTLDLMLIVFRLLQGAAQAFTAIALLAFASDCLPKDKLTSGIGIYSLGQTATQALAPAFGLWLADAFGYPVMCAVCAVLVLAAAIVTAAIPDDFVRSKPFRITLRGIAVREALIPALVMGLLVMTYSMVSSYLLIYADVQGVAGIGVFFTVQACAMLISRPLTSRLADRFGTVSVLLPALVLFGGAYFLLSGASELPVYLAAAVAIGFGYGACQPLIQALCIKCAGPDRRGSASNTNYLGFDLGNMLGPILAGRLVDQCGYAQTWKFMTIPIAAALVVLLCWRRQANVIEGRG